MRGRVQGVGFRWSTARTADELDLRGTVRNRPDGSVEVHARGSAGALDRLREWLREGPPSARVVEVEEVPPREDWPDGFRILR